MYGKCWLCGKVGAVERHHIFGGSNRNKSERDGLVVLLCGDTCHRNGPRAAHQCAETALELKILADAAAGMNRFANAKFEPVIRAVQQLVTETQSNAPDAQISEATRRTPPEDEKTAQKGGTRASMAGKKAKTASSKNLALAEAMEEDGASREEIWKKTGWLRGADGQWRFEIDDSKAVFRKLGDAKLMDEDGYRRLQELTDKWADSFERGEELSQAEESEMEALEEEYSDRIWEKKYELQDFLKHDELYDAYPLARHKSRELAGENDLNQSYKAQAIIESGGSDKDIYAALAAVYTGDGDAEKLKSAQAEGIPAKEYTRFRMEVGKLESDKDEEGKTISGSKKEKVIELINSLKLTSDQKEWIMEQTYKNVNWWEMPW